MDYVIVEKIGKLHVYYTGQIVGFSDQSNDAYKFSDIESAERVIAEIKARSYKNRDIQWQLI